MPVMRNARMFQKWLVTCDPPLYLGSSRCARPLPRGYTGHVARPTRSIRARLRRDKTASQGGRRTEDRCPESAVHGVIELVEKALVIFLSLFSCETQRIHFLDADLFRIGLALQDRHHFVDEFF